MSERKISERILQQSIFIFSLVLATAISVAALISDLGFLEKDKILPPASSWLKLFFYGATVLLISVSTYLLVAARGTNRKRMPRLWAFVIAALVFGALSGLRLGLGFGVDRISGTFGLTLSLIVICIGFSITLFTIEQRLVDDFKTMKQEHYVMFEELKREQASKGRLVRVTSAAPWRFEGAIVGWNPNWALELNTNPEHQLSRDLRRVHRDRITDADVSQIEYLFLKGYDPDEHGAMKFGTTAFLKFLNESFASNEGEPSVQRAGPNTTEAEHGKDASERAGASEALRMGNSVKDHVGKYQIWELEKDIWSGNSNDEKHKKIFDEVKSFLSCIVISGTRNGRNQSILFLNTSQFIDGRGHTHCIEIHDDDFNFYASWRTVKDLMADAGIKPSSVIWSNGKFELGT